MIPTVHVACRGGGMEVKFQSRNREAYDSNLTRRARPKGASTTFQSRNREAYDSNFFVNYHIMQSLRVSIS